jgi:hypothetical protein
MDESNVSAKPDPKELEPRPPVEADLAALCRELNQRGARYVVIGGFAVIAAGLPRMTDEFASPRLLWRMKAVTHREKDAADLVFLRYWFAERGQEPPECS